LENSNGGGLSRIKSNLSPQQHHFVGHGKQI
jgi:hypothetical protein